ncbi:hypothetical protein [Micromonospora polyrhachis]|uniref:Cytoskeletal protein RodZ n=1 Tax=Micromonospora polyrhachis TaxID=1282883 RepID=A0A7W7SVI6_9ACTN|nr:hypothetical protein [Micromonospora polyrhachis]MBB4961643.1 cytoskeletal protein RodZ [Micromonospora polyrhachis]
MTAGRLAAAGRRATDRAEEQPKTTTDHQAHDQAEEQPKTTTDHQAHDQAEEQPKTTTDHQAHDQAEEQPKTTTDHQAHDQAEEQPKTTTDHQAHDQAEEQPVAVGQRATAQVGWLRDGSLIRWSEACRQPTVVASPGSVPPAARRQPLAAPDQRAAVWPYVGRRSNRVLRR